MHSKCDVNVTSRYNGRLWKKVWKFKSSVYSHRTCRQSIKLPKVCIKIREDHYRLPSEVIAIRHFCHWPIGYGGRVEETGGNKNTCSPLTSIMQPKWYIYTHIYIYMHICIYALYITRPSTTCSLTTLIVLFKILLSSLRYNWWPTNCTGQVIVKWYWKRYLMISVSLKPGEYTHVLETNVDF